MYITLPERRLIYDIRAAEKLSHSNIGKEFRIFQHDLSGIFKKGYVKYKERLTGKFNMVKLRREKEEIDEGQCRDCDQ